MLNQVECKIHFWSSRWCDCQCAAKEFEKLRLPVYCNNSCLFVVELSRTRICKQTLSQLALAVPAPTKLIRAYFCWNVQSLVEIVALLKKAWEKCFYLFHFLSRKKRKEKKRKNQEDFRLRIFMDKIWQECFRYPTTLNYDERPLLNLWTTMKELLLLPRFSSTKRG